MDFEGKKMGVNVFRSPDQKNIERLISRDARRMRLCGPPHGDTKFWGGCFDNNKFKFEVLCCRLSVLTHPKPINRIPRS